MHHNIYKIFFLVGFICLTNVVWAQKECAVWYFGDNAGLDFTMYYPKPLSDGQTNTPEGVASISNSNGELLFYTDGVTIWNKNHQVMDNGHGLFGNTSSTQSCLIVPWPAHPDHYFIFTTDLPNDKLYLTKGMNYSLVDMSMDNNLGSVIEKNHPIMRSSTEKIAAIRHSNGMDFWVFGHTWKNSTFHIHKVTEEGFDISDEDVSFQVIGEIQGNLDLDDEENTSAIGYLKFSPQGNYLAQAIKSHKIIELFSFNRETGRLVYLATLPIGTQDNPEDPYGLEFSPTDNYLYASTTSGGQIYRWDLSNQNGLDIISSREIINPSRVNESCGALQLAFTGKIYITYPGKQYLGVINNPTKINCKFYETGTSLIDQSTGLGGTAQYGLPGFLPEYFTAAKFYYVNTCIGDTTNFFLSTVYGLGSTQPEWTIFDEDGLSELGKAEVDHLTLEGKFRFPHVGKYFVQLFAVQYGDTLNERQEIHILELPELNFQDTTLVCIGQTTTLDAGEGAFYQWSDNIHLENRYRDVSITGEYSVRVIHNNGCAKYDTTLILELPLPVIEEIITENTPGGYNGGSIEVITEHLPSEYVFEWQEFPDSSGYKLSNLEKGVYNLALTSVETGCTLFTSISISDIGAPEVKIIASPEGKVCPGTKITLLAEGATDYKWISPADLTTNSIDIYPYQTNTYVVEGFTKDSLGNQFSGFDEITIEVWPYQPPQLGPDQSYCANTQITLDGGGKYFSWLWKTGDTSRFFIPQKSETDLWLHVLDQNGCLQGDTINIRIKPMPEINLGKDRIVCESTILDAGSADIYEWNTGDDSKSITIHESGMFSVKTTIEGCSVEDSVYIQVNLNEDLDIDTVMTYDASCNKSNDGAAEVLTKKATIDIEYSLDSGQNWFLNEGLFEGLSPGDHYSLMLRKDSACQNYWPYKIEIKEPLPIEYNYNIVSPTCELCDDGQIILIPRGGTAPYQAYWDDLGAGLTKNNCGLGEHRAWILDANQCKSLVQIEMIMVDGPLSIPNAFTPNNDGVNDKWQIQSIDKYKDAIVRIFDKSGKLIYQSPPGYPNPWDGTSQGEQMPMGTYFYIISADPVSEPIKGSLTLIR